MRLTAVYRITVFIPPEWIESLRTSLRATGALAYGHYADVMWTSAIGEECFTPHPGTAPTKGSAGETTHCDSTQVVFSIAPDKARLEAVMDAITSAHPWEEPVVFIDETKAVNSQGH